MDKRRLTDIVPAEPGIEETSAEHTDAGEFVPPTEPPQPEAERVDPATAGLPVTDVD